ncbi:hypothetical protein CSC67_14890 [Pusillimonas caeni]|uniref:hypothetical protein n=1 Tax=Pusillimonas caeni TaxID=1348472 RepID=UPI000E5A0606|nr:hypothetical protein [Pusillimonas caeni]TFL13177.1 hypothetical protein CSC67_14890 [Pusillimonas caeni]
MAKKASAARMREVKIELLRARAAIERQTLHNSLHHLGQDLQPRALLRSLLPAAVSRKRPTDWLFQGVGLMRRYPVIVSTASALLSGVRKRHRLLRLGAGLLLSWQVARNMGGRDQRGPGG